MKTINTRGMMEGAILAALTAILGMFYNLPLVSMITMFWPVPIIIVGYRNGFRVSMIAAFIAATLVSIMATPIVGVMLFTTYAIPGAVMGYMMRKQFRPSLTLLVGGVLLSITAVLQFVFSLELLLGIPVLSIIGNFNNAVSGYFNQIYTQAKAVSEIYINLGYSEAEMSAALDRIYKAVMELKVIMPTIFITAGVMVSYFNFKAVVFILRRIGFKVEDVQKFSEMRLDMRYKFVVLGLTFAVLLLTSNQVKFLYTTYTNIWAILRFFYAVLGVSVIAYFVEQFSKKHEIPKLVKNLLLAFFIMITWVIAPFIGMFDIAADIRRLDRKTPGGAQ